MNINQQIAIKGAELLGWIAEPCDQLAYWFHVESNTYMMEVDDFDPVNNANDMNKLIEALQLDVTWNTGIWTAGNFDVFARDESRDEAILQCVIKALGVDNA